MRAEADYSCIMSDAEAVLRADLFSGRVVPDTAQTSPQSDRPAAEPLSAGSAGRCPQARRPPPLTRDLGFTASERKPPGTELRRW